MRRLHHEESLALNGQIERIAGLLQRALRHAQPVAAQQAVVVHRLAQLRVQRVRPQQHRAEELPLGAVARRLRIGQIGRRRVQSLGARHQPRHRRIVSAVHRQVSCSTEDLQNGADEGPKMGGEMRLEEKSDSGRQAMSEAAAGPAP